MSPDVSKAPSRKILLVDDDEAFLHIMGRALQAGDCGEVVPCRDPRELPRLLEQHVFGAVILDLNMPHFSGEDLLIQLVDEIPDTPVLMVTGMNQAETVVRCIKAGAFDYLVKPVEFEKIVAVASKALRYHGVLVENRRLRQRILPSELQQSQTFSRLITRAPAMINLFRYLEAVAQSPEPVLIVGETGTGKELVAEAVHMASGRPGPLVPVNIAGLDATAFTDTLFGHRKGSFTGADRDREGLVAKAADGTLFLDEIGSMHFENQIKLLRLIQEGEYMPLGADTAGRSRCRIVAATHVDLDRAMRAGIFRPDLFHRLHIHMARIPPLRERIEDIPLLVEHFLEEAAALFAKPKPAIPVELYDHLACYEFPGNVRELRAMTLDAVASHGRGVMSLGSFLRHIDLSRRQGSIHATPLGPCGTQPLAFGSVLPTLDEATRLLFMEALNRTRGNQKAAAALVGVSRRTMNRHTTETPPEVGPPGGEGWDKNSGIAN
jgi:DNA-binding NtrC family response regulator